MQHCNYKNQSILAMALCGTQNDPRVPASPLTYSRRHLGVPAWYICLCSVASPSLYCHGMQCLQQWLGSVEEAGCHSSSSRCLMVQKSLHSTF